MKPGRIKRKFGVDWSTLYSRRARRELATFLIRAVCERCDSGEDEVLEDLVGRVAYSSLRVSRGRGTLKVICRCVNANGENPKVIQKLMRDANLDHDGHLRPGRE